MSEPTARDLIEWVDTKTHGSMKEYLVRRVEAVLALHVHTRSRAGWANPPRAAGLLEYCAYCLTRWPCPTRRALEGEK